MMRMERWLAGGAVARDLTSGIGMTDSDTPVLPPGYRLIARDSVGSTTISPRELVAHGTPTGAVVGR